MTDKIPQMPTRSVPIDKVGDRSATTRNTMTRAGFSRTGTSRAKKQALRDKIKSVLYTNVLKVPDAVEKRLLEKGYETRWVRYKVSEFGRDDRANVAKWVELGYDFVKPEDAPELVFGYSTTKHETFGNLITVGDLALAKVPIEVKEAILEVKAEETLRRSKGILNDRPDGVTAGRRSFVTRAQKRAEELNEDVEGEDPDLLDGM